MNPFTDVPYIQPQQASGKIAGSAYLDNARALQIGAGNTGMRVQAGKGIWLGAKVFEDAPFSVDMYGNVVATTLVVGGGDALTKTDSDQPLSGSINVGNGNVKIDGVNKRILINDGTNDRILIGFQSGGF